MRLSILLLILGVYSIAAFNETLQYDYVNWAGNIRFTAPRKIDVSSVSEVQDVVRSAKNLRVVASTHAANPQIETSDVLLSLRSMNKVIGIDNNVIHVEAGCSFSDILPTLVQHGLEFPTLLCTPDLSVVGTILTASHGSGANASLLNSLVREITVVRADGSIDIVSNPDQVQFESLSLGLFGVVTSMKLQLYPAFSLKQCIYENVPLHHFVSTETNQDIFEKELVEKQANIEHVFRQGFSVSLFTVFGGIGHLGAGASFLGKTNPPGPVDVSKAVLSSVWLKTDTEKPCPIVPSENSEELSSQDVWKWGGSESELQGNADVATVPILPGRNPDTSTASSPALAHSRLAHFVPDADAQGANGSHDELQTEYYIPFQESARVLSQLVQSDFIQELIDVIHISELRMIQSFGIAGNSISPCSFASKQSQQVAYESDPLVDANGRVLTEPRLKNESFSGCLTLQFTWSQKHNARAMNVMKRVEAIIKPLGARPHWGKLFDFTPKDLQDMYSQQVLEGFAAYAQKMDPEGKFRSPFLQKFFFSDTKSKYKDEL